MVDDERKSLHTLLPMLWLLGIVVGVGVGGSLIPHSRSIAKFLRIPIRAWFWEWAGVSESDEKEASVHISNNTRRWIVTLKLGFRRQTTS